MWKEKLSEGTRVKNVKDGRFGAVVPDALGVCGKNAVMVEYDHSTGEEATNRKALKTFGFIRPETDTRQCQDCIFFNGLACLRYRPGRIGMLLEERNGRRVPKRIYPFCKNGHSP